MTTSSRVIHGGSRLRTIIHLVRHGEVHNPTGMFYGRLPGFGLSENGRLMVERAASQLVGRDVVQVVSSPLDRATETAAQIAACFDLPVRPDERLTEAMTVFEGLAGWNPRSPLQWMRLAPHLVNPFRPSWGEPYANLAARMLDVLADIRASVRGHEAACVSHQLPIWVARRALERRRLWHRASGRQCALASITTLTYVDDRLESLAYLEPSWP